MAVATPLDLWAGPNRDDILTHRKAVVQDEAAVWCDLVQDFT